MGKLQRVEDLTAPPIVGKFYLVPCIRNDGDTWPITGPKHADGGAVGFPHDHWHYDLRFLANDQTGRISAFSTVAIKMFRYPNRDPWDPASKMSDAPFLSRRRCNREQPEYPERKVRRLWLGALETECEGRKVTCGKCPHRGLPLSSLPREPGTDIVTCPGHGLRWDLKTGSLVRPSPEPASRDSGA